MKKILIILFLTLSLCGCTVKNQAVNCDCPTAPPPKIVNNPEHHKPVHTSGVFLGNRGTNPVLFASIAAEELQGIIQVMNTAYDLINASDQAITNKPNLLASKKAVSAVPLQTTGLVKTVSIDLIPDAEYVAKYNELLLLVNENLKRELNNEEIGTLESARDWIEKQQNAHYDDILNLEQFLENISTQNISWLKIHLPDVDNVWKRLANSPFKLSSDTVTSLTSLFELLTQILTKADADTESIHKRIAMHFMKEGWKNTNSDTMKPTVFFRAPGNWLNDPNGLIYQKEQKEWHLFYQLNPYGDDWGNIVWGHASSKDLVHWMHQPPSIVPLYQPKTSQLIFSGGVYKNKNDVLAFFTGIGRGQSFRTSPSQRLAIAQDATLKDFSIQKKELIKTNEPNKPIIYDERDPCLFQSGGQTFMILGGTLDPHRKKDAVVTLYRASNSDLTEWDYIGILLHEKKVGLIECPKMIKIGDRWLLVVSPQGKAAYHIGSFNSSSNTFSIEASGLLDEMPASHMQNFYAPYLEQAPDGRIILSGWVTSAKPFTGWNGAIVFRELTIENDIVVQSPLRELEALRKENRRIESLKPGQTQIAIKTKSNAFEIAFKLSGKQRVDALINGLSFQIDRNHFSTQQATLSLETDSNESLNIRIFVDGGLIQFYANGKCITQMSQLDPEASAITLLNGSSFSNLDLWELESTWNNESQQLLNW